jgi:heat shock protein HslJ
MRALLLLSATLGLAACATSGIGTLDAAQDAYKASGTEPFWSLSIDPRVMIFSNAGGERTTEQTPQRVAGAGGTSYRGARVQVDIKRQSCSDGMSERRYPDTVQAVVDGKSYSGCGGTPIEAGELPGTAWSVESVGGKAVAGEGIIRFTDDRISARFGCNTFTGGYAVDGITLSVGTLASTRMACPDPSVEQEAARVLGQPLTLAFLGTDRLTLGGKDGYIVLRPIR